MADRVLTPRALNRATLARQLLLTRAECPALDAVAAVVGLQAQLPNPPYIGLWSRLNGFRHAELTRLLEERQAVRATLMRSTLHLVTAEDYLFLRPALQPALTRALNAFFSRQAKLLDIDRLVAAARDFFAKGPRTFTELRALLAGIEPDLDPAAMAYAVRTHLPLVQAPPGGTWNSGGSPAYALAESWLGRPLADPAESLPRLIRRYLAAFGPASVRDLQTWSGLTGLKGVVAEMRGELVTYRDERGKELLDLPDCPLPPADTRAPVRFLPEYDNLILAHADRARVVADDHRPAIFLSAGRVRATFLLDGFARGTWKIERAGKATTLVIEPLAPIAPPDRAALAEEAERLACFISDPSEPGGVRFADEF